MSTQTITAPRNREKIREMIVKELGGISDYCARNKMKYTVVMNVLKGFTPHTRHPEIVAKINADTGADLKAWEK